MKYKNFVVFVLLLVSGCSSSRTYLVSGQIVDGKGGPPLKGGVVVIEKKQITRILHGLPADLPADASVIRAETSTVMPGLINVHTHMMSGGECKWVKGFSFDQLYRNLKVTVAEGVTTVVDLGSAPAAIMAVRKWADKHPTLSPRILYAGPFVTAPGGYPLDWLPDEFKKFGGVEQVNSVEDARAVIKKLIQRYHVNVVKVGVVEKSFNFKPIPRIKKDVLSVLVEEAHKDGLRVFAHATYANDYRLAAEAGVDVIAHGALEPLSDETIKLLIQNKTIVAPTLWVFMAVTQGKEMMKKIESTPLKERLTQSVTDDLRAYVKEYEASGEFVPHAIQGVKKELAAVGTANSKKNLLKLFMAGVPIALGTDSAYCFDFHGSPYEEMRLMVKAGLSPMDVLEAATRNSARAAGIDKTTGSLEPGKIADILVVNGDPLKDISAIKNIKMVFRDGKEVSLKTVRPTFFQKLSLGWAVVKGFVGDKIRSWSK